jgi:hypothetical protein
VADTVTVDRLNEQYSLWRDSMLSNRFHGNCSFKYWLLLLAYCTILFEIDIICYVICRIQIC